MHEVGFYYTRSKKSIFVLVNCRILFFLFSITAEKWATSPSAASPNCRHVITRILPLKVWYIIFPANMTVKLSLRRGEWFSSCDHNYIKLYKLEMKTLNFLDFGRWTKTCVESLAECLDMRCLFQLLFPDCCNCTKFLSSQHRFGSVWITTVIIVWYLP